MFFLMILIKQSKHNKNIREQKDILIQAGKLEEAEHLSFVYNKNLVLGSYICCSIMLSSAFTGLIFNSLGDNYLYAGVLWALLSIGGISLAIYDHLKYKLEMQKLDGLITLFQKRISEEDQEFDYNDVERFFEKSKSKSQEAMTYLVMTIIAFLAAGIFLLIKL